MDDNSDNSQRDDQFPIIGNGAGCGCDSDDCCPGGSSSSTQPNKTIKTAIFVIVMLAAFAVGAYSLIGKHAADDAGLNSDLPLDSLTVQQTAFTGNILGDNQFGFLTLKGAGAALDKNAEVESLTESAAALIRKKGITVTTVSVSPGDSLFAAAVDLFGLTALPSVLAMNREGRFVLLAGDITENGLLKTYLSGCSASDCGTGCDPKACGN